jgi:hypothetical protein
MTSWHTDIGILSQLCLSDPACNGFASDWGTKIHCKEIVSWQFYWYLIHFFWALSQKFSIFEWSRCTSFLKKTWVCRCYGVDFSLDSKDAYGHVMFKMKLLKRWILKYNCLQCLLWFRLKRFPRSIMVPFLVLSSKWRHPFQNEIVTFQTANSKLTPFLIFVPTFSFLFLLYLLHTGQKSNRSHSKSKKSVINDCKLLSFTL